MNDYVRQHILSALIKSLFPQQSTSSATTTPAPAPATPAVTTPAPEPAQPVAAAAPPTTTPTTAPAATQPTSVDNMLVSGQEYATAVAEMEAMGFQKAEVGKFRIYI